MLSFVPRAGLLLRAALAQTSVLCRERDSNPHSRYGQGILSPSCLPFHHRGDLGILKTGCKGTKKSVKRKVKSEKFTYAMHFLSFFTALYLQRHSPKALL